MPFTSDEEFVSQFEDFADTSVANKTVLNFPADDQTTGNNFKDALIAQLNAMQAAEQAYNDARVTFRNTRKDATAFQNSRKRYFGANPNVPDGIKAQLNIQLNAGQSGAGVLAQPVNLSANGYESGYNELKWERNGNSNQRMFEIQYRAGENGAWLIAGSTRKTVFRHDEQTPGAKIYYRVRAVTDTEKSPFSNTAVVYG